MKLLSTYMPGSNQLSADLSGKFSDKGPLLFILRHGQIKGHGTRRFIGQTDIPLDQTGREQARSWQAPFAAVGFKQVYTSALTRCRQTAAFACPDSTSVIDRRLNEIDLGEWDGREFEHIKTKHPDLFEQRGRDIYGFCPPAGESFKDLFSRVSPFFSQLPLLSHTLLVTHAGVIRAMLCFWAGKKMENLLNFKTHFGQLFVLAKE
ncbi:histidine phosphatase family protein [Desulfobacter postgatei]|nr:histidine phosphatase family protein [Desulfobacter postgatei]